MDHRTRPIPHALETGAPTVKWRRLRMFGRNTVTSTIAFALDLALLWGLVELLDMAHLPAAIIAFFVPLTFAYILTRQWVFPGSHRGVAEGYL